MVPPGRPRKVDPTVPRHIDQTKIPTGIYWDGRKGKGTWYGFDRKPGERTKRKNLAGPTATLADLHAIAEARAGKTSSKVLRGLCDAFENSPQVRARAHDTRKDYAYCRAVVCEFKLANGQLFGDLVTKRITPPVVQGLIDAIAAGVDRDDAGELIPTPSKAAHAQRYLRRMFRWGITRGFCEINPADGIEMPTERKLRRLPEKVVLTSLIAFAQRQGGGRGQRGSVAPYLWAVVTIAYRCRLRPIEVRTLTDANHTAEGILTNRRKGSRDNITGWSEDLRTAWDFLAERRRSIWSGAEDDPDAAPGRKARRPARAIPFRPEDRPILVNNVGEPVGKSTFDSAWRRLIQRAIEDGVMSEEQRFGAHDLKRRGITDTPGTRPEKQLASGHKQESMLDVYDYSIPFVLPAGSS